MQLTPLLEYRIALMTTIAQNLNAFGFTPVIARITNDSGEAARLSKHFSAEPSSQLGSASLALKAEAGVSHPRAGRARVLCQTIGGAGQY